MISRLTGLSHDQQDALRREARAVAAPRRGGGPAARAAVNQNWLPCPSSLATPIVPPISAASLREIDRPSPVPP